MPRPLRKCPGCERMIRSESSCCMRCWQEWGRYVDWPDRGHGLGNLLTREQAWSVVVALADQGRKAGEDVEWLIR